MSAGLGLWCALIALPARAAEPDLTATISAATGQVFAPFHTAEFPRTASEIGQTRLLAMELRAAFPRELSGELRLMVAHVGVEQPAGSYRFTWLASHAHLALGTPLWRRGSYTLSAGGALAIPLHGALPGSLTKQRAYALANGLTGFADQPLFTPGVVAAVPETRLRASYHRGALDGQLQLPLYVRLADVRLPAAVTRTVAISPVLSFGGELAVVRRLTLALHGVLVANWLGPTRDPRTDAAQLLLVPSLTLARRRVHAPDVTLRAVAPLAGIVERTFQLALRLRWDVSRGGGT